jgi:phosphinothricin acetyltransferase
MTFEILKLETLTNEIQAQVTTLYKQLNADNKQSSLKEILQPENNVIVFLCKIDNKVVGTALLSTCKLISGYRGMIDDVVVDVKHRRKGIGRKLMEYLLKEGKNLDQIILFTGHHRTPAIKLYTSLGFELRQSGLYSFKIF